MKYLSKTEKDTQAFAAQLAKKLKGGEIIALEGDLGAGKTTMTKSLAKALDFKQTVTSPTFVLMKVYEHQGTKTKIRNSARLGRSQAFGIRNLVHIDCYRLDEPQELFYLGIEEYLNKPDTIVIIEWADKIKKYLKGFKKIVWVKIKIKNHQRIININKN